ncbi:hypothetical protein [Cellulosimicrobium sp. TH-20]|uniref:hypothetical protein n=1 Tax=Cellulosimicrobium sp. TH-20 TaxID=1980001 RepID=UPI0016426163|nr:hypothetical protein [Cellulosimicrobium sp. TH-20]
MVDEDGEAPKGEVSSPEVGERDAVEALEVRFYGVGVLAQEGEETRQFPETPTAF